nr:group II intron reverse transcriptase/maturase [Cryptomonas sp. NIES-3952]
MEQDNMSISWNFLPWKKFRKKSFGLQRKIYAAKQNKNYKEIKRFQKLLIASKSLHYVAVKKVTDSSMAKGIFVSRQVKLNMVNELHEILRRGKNLVCSSEKSLPFSSMQFLKNDAFYYIWKLILDPLYLSRFSAVNIRSRFDFTNYSKKVILKSHVLSKIKREIILLMDTSSQSASFDRLKTVVNIPTKYKFIVAKLILSMSFDSYFRFEYSIFRTTLYTLFLRIILLSTEKINTYKFLITLNLLENIDSVFH